MPEIMATLWLPFLSNAFDLLRARLQTSNVKFKAVSPARTSHHHRATKMSQHVCPSEVGIAKASDVATSESFSRTRGQIIGLSTYRIRWISIQQYCHAINGLLQIEVRSSVIPPVCIDHSAQPTSFEDCVSPVGGMIKDILHLELHNIKHTNTTCSELEYLDLATFRIHQSGIGQLCSSSAVGDFPAHQ